MQYKIGTYGGREGRYNNKNKIKIFKITSLQLFVKGDSWGLGVKANGLK